MTTMEQEQIYFANVSHMAYVRWVPQPYIFSQRCSVTWIQYIHREQVMSSLRRTLRLLNHEPWIQQTHLVFVRHTIYAWWVYQLYTPCIQLEIISMAQIPSAPPSTLLLTSNTSECHSSCSSPILGKPLFHNATYEMSGIPVQKMY